MDNIDVTAEELSFIRSLCDFDLTMVLSEVNDNGWKWGRKLLPIIREARSARGEQ